MWMDLIGLYNYDQTLLDSLVLPEDLEDKRDIIKENILLETAEQELIYPDATFLKYAIGVWSAKQSPIWEELYKTTQYEYNPIWNVDGTTVEDRDLEGTDYLTDDHTTTRTHTDTITRTHNDTIETTYDNGSTTKDTVYAFNSSTGDPSDEVRVDNDGTTTDDHTGTITDAHTGSITDKDTGTRKHDTSDSGTVTTTKTGNIGVTSTQSLIQEQREVVKLNIIDVIIKDFADRFCLKVY